MAASCHESRAYLDKLSEQQKALVKPLIARVEHWKGHCLCSFGKPLLQAKVMVSRTPVSGGSHLEEPVTRQYQIFLFSNILICCRKRTQPNSRGKDWALKGRVFLRNIYNVEQTGDSKLCISYHGDDGSDTFVIDFARPSLLARWASVLDYYRERAAEPRSLEEASMPADIPPPAYYSPLPEYTSSSSPGTLFAPAMERHSPLNTPLSSPPLYTPSDTLPQDYGFGEPSQILCRPAMISTLSASSISSDIYDFNAATLDADSTLDEETSFSSPQDKLETNQYSSRSTRSLVAIMAEAPSIYYIIPFVVLCALLSYLGIVTHRRALFGDEELLQVF